MMDELCRSNVCDLVVIDSVAALVPRAELEGDIGSVQVGGRRRGRRGGGEQGGGQKGGGSLFHPQLNQAQGVDVGQGGARRDRGGTESRDKESKGIGLV